MVACIHSWWWGNGWFTLVAQVAIFIFVASLKTKQESLLGVVLLLSVHAYLLYPFKRDKPATICTILVSVLTSVLLVLAK